VHTSDAALTENSGLSVRERGRALQRRRCYTRRYDSNVVKPLICNGLRGRTRTTSTTREGCNYFYQLGAGNPSAFHAPGDTP
jgi:hypothetical protein